MAFDDEFDAAYQKWKAGPKSVGAFATRPTSQVRTPKEVVTGLGNILKRNAIPVGALGATGALLDWAAPEAGIPLMLARAALMGGENVALNKALPESLGGDPNASNTMGFLTGAVPEMTMLGGGRAISKILEKNLARRAEGAIGKTVGKLDENALAAGEHMLAPGARQPYPQGFGTGPELTQQTFAAQAPINQTIQSARTKYGAPIGEAYKALKPDIPIDATGFADFADDLRKEMLSPTTGPANKLLAQFRALDPKAQKEAFDQANPEYAWLREDQKSQLFKESNTTGANADILRNLRQQVTTQLQNAQGGDRYILGRLQEKLDSQLMPHLPPEMSQLRRNYAGFMKRWSYRDQQALSRLENPQQVADFVFKDPVKAQDLFSEANPAQQEQLRSQFLQHVYGPLNDTTETFDEQVKAVRKRLAPYMKDRQTAQMVFGPNAGAKMQEMARWPKFTEDFKTLYDKDPTFRNQLVAGVKKEIIQGKMDPDAAAQKMVTMIAQPHPQLGQIIQGLPAPTETVKRNPFASRGKFYHGAMLATGLGGAALTGHMGMGVPWQVGALVAAFTADRIGTFSTASKLGITAPLLRAMSNKNGYIAGRLLGRTLLNAGARDVQSNASQPVELY